MLRKLNPKRIIYVLQMILSAFVPNHPFERCRHMTRCPCPLVKPSTTAGVAIGDNVSMNL